MINGFGVQISTRNLSNTKQDSYQLSTDIPREDDPPGTCKRSSKARSVCTSESQTGNPCFQEYVDAFMQRPKAYILVIHCSGTTFPSTPVAQEIWSHQNIGLLGVTSRDVPDDSNFHRHRCEKLSDFHALPL
jgi:hypothetical protein